MSIKKKAAKQLKAEFVCSKFQSRRKQRRGDAQSVPKRLQKERRDDDRRRLRLRLRLLCAY